jgi:hypothetical protein
MSGTDAQWLADLQLALDCMVAWTKRLAARAGLGRWGSA